MGKITLKLKFRMIFFVLTCLAILAADLTIAFINKYILSYKGMIDKHYVTLMGMAAVLVIFYLFVKYINRISDWFVNKFVHITRVYLGREIGLYVSIIVLLLLTFAGYYWIWFDRNIFSEVQKILVSVPSHIKSLF